MTDVSDWADEMAKAWYPTSGKQSSRWNQMQVQGQGATIRTAKHLAALLLSDEAVEAAADQMWRNGGVVSGSELRLALQAALNAITNPETPISGTTEQTGA